MYGRKSKQSTRRRDVCGTNVSENQLMESILRIESFPEVALRWEARGPGLPKLGPYYSKSG